MQSYRNLFGPTGFNFFVAISTLMLFSVSVNAQVWVDTLYNYQLTQNVSYGTATDFAGNERLLLLDVCVPTNDTPPACGRPLLVAIHGGAWMAGSKNDPMIQQLMKDFAKRGYVTASVNYRLGMFQTSSSVNCNISSFNLQWNCFNQADTMEWHRAWFRGVQDVKGAIRYLIANASQYNIDPRNVFVVGESAGGFIALGIGFLDDESEKPQAAFAHNSVNPPNALYESQCVQGFGLDTSIASMQLERPDLGAIHGDLNLSAPAYRIRGVANFYGGMFYNLFNVNNYDSPPVVYLFHQPNDLIVSHQRQRLLSGYAYCATFFGCQYIINRPYASGSAIIRDYVEQLNAANAPNYLYDSTLNNADCTQQALNPNSGGHQVDSYWLRSVRMAQLFASHVDTTNNCVLSSKALYFDDVKLFPNPASNIVYIHRIYQPAVADVIDVYGRTVLRTTVSNNAVDVSGLSNGVYLIRAFALNGGEIFPSKRLVIAR